MRIILPIAALLPLLFALAGAPAQAANSSAYTPLDTDKCIMIDKPTGEGEYAGTWACAGYKRRTDYQVVVSEDDLRGQVSFGRNTRNHCAASMTFPRFNSPGKTVEWRISNDRPIATILRWTVSYGDENPPQSRTWLVITRVEAGNSCHMAYVEGAMPNANQTARAIADTLAPQFKCETGVLTVHARPETDTSEVPSGPACRPR